MVIRKKYCFGFSRNEMFFSFPTFYWFRKANEQRQNGMHTNLDKTGWFTSGHVINNITIGVSIKLCDSSFVWSVWRSPIYELFCGSNVWMSTVFIIRQLMIWTLVSKVEWFSYLLRFIFKSLPEHSIPIKWNYCRQPNENLYHSPKRGTFVMSCISQTWTGTRLLCHLIRF